MAISNPVTILAGTITSIASGVASGAATTSAAKGTAIVAALGGNTVNSNITNFIDSVGNVYVRSGIAGTASNGAVYFAICRYVTVPIVSGSTTFTATISAGNWFQLGVYSIAGATQGTEGGNNVQNAAALNGTISTSGTLVSSNVIFLGQVVGSAGLGVITTAAGWTGLFNASAADVAFKQQTGSKTAGTYNPTWTTSNAAGLNIIALDATFLGIPRRIMLVRRKVF